MRRSLRVYLLLYAGISLIILALFATAQMANIPLLQDPRPALGEKGLARPLLSILLMGSDVFLPIPSSILMTANGAWFGFLGGGLITMAGAALGGGLAYATGRLGERWIRKRIKPEEQQKTQRLLDRYGMLALVLTRPLPILAETTAILAGAARMRPGRFALGILAGSAPIAILYALAGARAVDLRTGLLSSVIILLVSAFFYWIGRRLPG